MESEALTSAQAARILDLSAERVRQLADTGVLACTTTPLGRLFKRSDVERLRAERDAPAANQNRPGDLR
jgi:DNA-binding transcriptional MerR regulator